MAGPALLPFAFSLAILLTGATATTFIFQNNCPYPVWPASLANAGCDPLPRTGFELQPRALLSLAAPIGWSGRMWARHRCGTDMSGVFSCWSGDCGTGKVECNGQGGAPPATLIEFTLQGDGAKDSYDVSCVDGFNVPVAVTPQGCSGGCCGRAACPQNVNAYCPRELWATAADGSVVGCKSACLAFDRDDYCCRGAYGSRETCKATRYSEVFKGKCPQAVTYAFDDVGTTFTCAGADDYLVTFCPGS